ncbi:dTDP-4-dehydrorhamnose reductase [Magnetospirillum fulvum]|uniref:dTDP-4-dehydrorhamnose reductase n=1 Tax=Magnetospirillum fulvum MGU-K5 TaxID=1316936 RepID=S9S973_MAGFU|nr:dTDP-4-dehydrorhamnose reductase [Magnetospirillum fulvum]EPY01239.1 dTDP-4-dehydrorhamnose reductase [Magnetospirillum fulvum MGU-K5]
MRIVVTGCSGQIATALQQRGAQSEHQIIAVGRPRLDLAWPKTVAGVLTAARPDIIVSAAAYTAVDKAETDRDSAFAINADGAAAIAATAARLGVPLIHLSTDYVFDGSKSGPYLESDLPAPINVYGESKLAGEQRVVALTANHVILRLSWVYSPFGNNFVRTMLRLAEDRETVRVVADQIGRPSSAFDIADAVISIAERLGAEPERAPRGLFHLSGAGETSWAGFAEAIFTGLRARGGRGVTVVPIPATDYPLPAARPANSVLCGDKLFAAYGLTLPSWRGSLSVCLERLIPSRDGAATKIPSEERPL